MAAMTGTSTTRDSTISQMEGKPTRAKTATAITTTTNKKLVPQRVCALGYFLASGVTTSSVTIQTTGLPPEYRARNEEFLKCIREARRINATLSSNMNQIFARIVPRLGQIFTNRIYEVNEITAEEEFVGLQFAPKECTTCQGTGKRPENW